MIILFLNSPAPSSRAFSILVSGRSTYRSAAMLRFTLVSQNEEFASHLGAFLFGNSMIWTAPSFLREKAALLLPTVGYGRNFKQTMSERIVKLLIESFPKILLPGLKMTIPLTVIAFSIAMVIAVIAAMIQYARVPVLRQIMRFYVWVVRGTPLLVQLFVVFYGLPSLGIILDPFPAAVIVFSINEGAYCAETMRAALESVPVGQMEAGYCVGMSYLQVMRRIVLPQALRTAFPPLSNSLIAMVKDTSLAANITVTEMFMATQKLVAYYYEPMALYIEVGVIYLIFSTVLTWVQRWGEKKLSAYGAQKE